MKNIILLAGLVLSLSSSAQTEKKIYYDRFMYVAELRNAEYYRIVTLDAGGVPVGIVRDYYITGERSGEGALSFLDPGYSAYDIKEGKWTLYYKNGKKKREGTYLKGRRNGTLTSWYENGKTERQGLFKNDLEQGLHKHWRTNGSLFSETNYQDGKYEGERRLYYDNGKLSYKEIYKEQQLHGSATALFRNGVVQWERKYVKGVLTDKCTPEFDSLKNLFNACNELYLETSKEKWKSFTDRSEFAWGNRSSYSVVKNGLIVRVPESERGFIYQVLPVAPSEIQSISATFRVQPDQGGEELFPPQYTHPHVGLVWNAKDSTSFSYMKVSDHEGSLSVGKQGHSDSYFMSNALLANRSGTRKLTVTRSGKNLDCYIDNIKVYTITNDTFNNTAIGVFVQFGEVEFTEIIYSTRTK